MWLMILGYLSAHALLAGLVAIVIRFARQEPDLDGRLAGVLEITHRETRLDAAHRELEWAKTTTIQVQEHLERARRRLAEFIPLPDETTTLVSFAVLAVLLFEGDSAVALLLNVSGNFAGLSAPMLAFITPLLTAGVFVFLHAVLLVLLQSGARHRPLRVYARARWGTAVTGLVVVAAGWAVLFGRSFDSYPWLVEFVTTWGLMTLALTLSLAGAFATNTVTALHGERGYERRVARLEALKSRLQRHVDQLQQDIDQHQQAPPRAPKIGGLSAIGTATMVLFFAVHAGHAWAAPSQAAETPATVAPRACELMVDVSRSLNAGARRQAVDQMAAALDSIAQNFGCPLLRFSAFSGDVPFNVVREAPPLLPVTAASDCSGVDGGQRSSAISNAVRTLYPPVGDAREDASRQRCAVDLAAQRAGEALARGKAVDAARAVWLDVSRVGAVGRCTALDFAVQEALARSDDVFVITDGVNDCRASGTAAASDRTPTCGQMLLFVIVPSADNPAPFMVRDRVAALRSRFLIAEVRFGSAMTPSQWSALSPRSPCEPKR